MEKIHFGLDPDVSLRDKGTLVVCLELVKKGLSPTIENIKNSGLDAERSISTSLHNLSELGYYRSIKYKVPGGPGFNWRYEVSEFREV